jgi:hypothetical protein
MPAIAPIEDLRNAQKELLEVKDVEELKRVFKKWRRIGWKNVCGAPIGKVREIQKSEGRRHPGPKRMAFLAGVNYGLKKAPQKN